MSYLRTLDRDAFAKYRSRVREGGSANPTFGLASFQWEDPLYVKADLAAQIACYAVNGKVLVCCETHYGPDYDGSGTPRYYEIDATLVTYRKWLRQMTSESEGVDCYRLVDWFSLDLPKHWADRGRALWDQDLTNAFNMAFCT